MDPINSWESIKVKIQSFIKEKTAFRWKQNKIELYSLWKHFKNVNCRFYSGETSLDNDRIQIELCIEHLCEEQVFFAKPELELEWLISEGKMVLSFLHLEDSRNGLPLESLLQDQVDITDNDTIIQMLDDFY